MPNKLPNYATQPFPLSQPPSRMPTDPYAPAAVGAPGLGQAVGMPVKSHAPAMTTPQQAIQAALSDQGGGDSYAGLDNELNAAGGLALPDMTDEQLQNFGNLQGRGVGANFEDTLKFAMPGQQSGRGDYLAGLGGGDDSSGGGMLSKLLGGMSNQDWLGAAGLGLGAVGQFMNASTQKDQFEKQFALEQQALAGQQSQLNPYAQQEAAYKMAVKQALGANGPAQAQLGSPTPIDPARGAIQAASNQYLSPEALSEAKRNFDTSLGKGGTPSALQNALMSGTNQEAGGDHSGPGFWSTLGKIGAIAAPIIAAPFTGGLSLAAIGAGSGAAGAALGGGDWKQMLLGAGLGAIPGVGTMKVAPASNFTTGLSNIGQAAIRNPLATAKSGLAVANALKR